MKLRKILGALALIIVPTIAASGQLATAENPFPETGVQEDAAVFDTTSGEVVLLKGVISQRVSRANHSPSYLFFRVEGTHRGRNAVKAIWTIRIHDPRVPTLSRICPDCLFTDYTPEMKRLDVGMNVTVTGYRSKKGDARLITDLTLVDTSPFN